MRREPYTSSGDGNNGNVKRETEAEVRLIRQQLFEKMLPVLMITGLPAFTFVLWRHYINNNFKLIMVYCLIYFAGIVTMLSKKWLHFKIRVYVAFGFLYFAGIFILFRFGLYSAGPMFLMTFSVLVTVLMGVRYGLIAMIVSFLAHVFITIGVGLDVFFYLSEDVFNAPPFVLWMQALCLFAMFGGIMVVAPGMLQERLLDSIEHIKTNTTALEKSNRLLMKEMKRSRTIEEDLRISEERYRSLSDATFEAVILSENDIFLDVNRAACEMFGYTKQELIGMHGRVLIAEESRKLIEDVITKGLDRPYEATAVRANGEKFIVNIRSKRSSLRNRNVHITVIRDIDEQKKAEAALKESEERFKKLSDASFEGIIFHDNGVIQEANKTFYRMFGYTKEELCGKEGMSGALTRESYEMIRNKIEKGDTEPYEAIAIRKDGSRFPIESQSKIVEYRGKKIRLAAIRDISYRKMTEKKLMEYQQQLRSMASMLTIAEETERRKIAVLLHDGICQSLASAGIQLKMMRADVDNDELKQRISEIAVIIEEMIRDTRSLTFELSPPILYEMSFEDAIKWLFEQYKEKLGISGDFIVDNFEDDLEEDKKILLFHCYRELLINMQKHADASNMHGSLSQKNGMIEIILKDNGKGFAEETPDEMQHDSKTGFGLFSIKERIRQFDGRLEVNSGLGQGTEISIYLPDV